MDFELDRRQLLKLAAMFSIAWSLSESGHAMDAAPSPSAPGQDAQTKGDSGSRVDDRQNGQAVDGSSNFKAVYGDPQLKAAFFLFLQNVYHIFPEDKLHKLIDEICSSGESDKDIYRRVQGRLDDIKPFLAQVRYSLPALSKQKAEMTRQTLELIGERRQLNGYMEIGTTGRYLGRLQSVTEIKGDMVLLHSDAPTYSPTDIVERGGIGKLGRFVSMRNYAAVASSDVADASLDVVSNYIGFHHCPLDRLDAYVRSLHRVLRPGGRLIVRDHDVNSRQMNRIVALAHDVFNMGLGVDWSVNQKELRYFTSLRQLVGYLEQRGFKSDKRTVFQQGDPTKNALMVFTKV